MKTDKTDDYRDAVMTHLMYIKEKVDANHDHLEKVNGRLNTAENNIGKIKSVGFTLFGLLSVAISIVGLIK
tara:strand:+ start:606 stop:818 length:213 start_codon:yes stop_codon:yes gene_type:complete